MVQVETLSSTKENNGSHSSRVMQSNTSLSNINTKLGEQWPGKVSTKGQQCINFQGAKKVNFTACPNGKLWLSCTSLKVISTSLKKFDEQDWLQFFCVWIPPPKITCPSGKLRTEFTSPTAKISFLFHFLCTLICPVPLKSKLTLEARNLRLDPRISKLDCFEFWDARIESRDERIESRVSLIEDRGSKKLCFLKERCCTVT